jgi:hypothetical protein
VASVSSSNPIPGWQKVSLDAVLIALVVSGLLWLLVHYTLGTGSEEAGLPHWSEAWLMRVHGLAGFAVLVTVGAFLPVHVPRGWRCDHRLRAVLLRARYDPPVARLAACSDWLRVGRNDHVAPAQAQRAIDQCRPRMTRALCHSEPPARNLGLRTPRSLASARDDEAAATKTAASAPVPPRAPA